jgi:hypothetical protein
MGSDRVIGPVSIRRGSQGCRRETLMSSSTVPDGPLSAAGAPYLPAGFTGMFNSRYIDTADVRLHAVTGGDGPPLLLVHGWPQTWYAWRPVMSALAGTSRSSRPTSTVPGGPANPPAGRTPAPWPGT